MRGRRQVYIFNNGDVKSMLRKHWNGGGKRSKKAFARSERSESDTMYPRSAFLMRLLPGMEVLSCLHFNLLACIKIGTYLLQSKKCPIQKKDIML